MTINEFLSHIDKSESCWIWKLGSSSGYGSLWIKGKYFHAHKLSYELTFGQVSKGLCVLHKCDVRRCVRPDHLFLGTRVDNAADRHSKGRTKKGSQLPQAKLDVDKVKIIKALIGNVTYREIGEKFNVSSSAIWLIANGKNWAHV